MSGFLLFSLVFLIYSHLKGQRKRKRKKEKTEIVVFPFFPFFFFLPLFPPLFPIIPCLFPSFSPFFLFLVGRVIFANKWAIMGKKGLQISWINKSPFFPPFLFLSSWKGHQEIYVLSEKSHTLLSVNSLYIF